MSGLLKSALYLGLDPKEFKTTKPVIHFPVIQTRPIALDKPEIRSVFSDLENYTHCIFTSKMAVNYFFEALRFYGLPNDSLKGKIIFSIGEVTSKELKKKGIDEIKLPKIATQEGMIALLKKQDWEGGYLFYPRSAIARCLLEQFLIKGEIRHQLCPLYETVPHAEGGIPDWEGIDEIVFTSPSTVNAFFNFFSSVPNGIALTSIGPVTEKALKFRLNRG